MFSVVERNNRNNVEPNPLKRRSVLKTTGLLIFAGTAAAGTATARGPPEEFPGSETGEENSRKGRETAAENRQKEEEEEEEEEE